jgi:(p)ppGpp synthase/HD superfamily hydrolase
MDTDNTPTNGLVARALDFASAAHAAVGQTRKYTGEPYINHPIEVRKILLKFAAWPVTAEQEAASLLHDTVEDTQVTSEDVHAAFGSTVGTLVDWLTDVSKPSDGNRRVRKQMDLDHTAAAPPAAKSVKLADLVSNSRSIVAHDPDFARVYLHEKARILDVCADADPGLLAEAYRVLTEGRQLLNSNKGA